MSAAAVFLPVGAKPGPFLTAGVLAYALKPLHIVVTRYR